MGKRSPILRAMLTVSYGPRVVTVRRATPDDAPELVRLRGVMLAAMAGHTRPARCQDRGNPATTVWQAYAERTLRMWLADPDRPMTALVVDDPESPGRLASCAVGVIEQRLSGPDNLSGAVGYVFSVATDPVHRRRGYSRACMLRLLAWFAQRGVTIVDLRASPEGEPLYRSLGFVRTTEPAMRLYLGP
jgi:GNAT superfamily N-acetyltransferase